jgi:predicted acyl esterase
VKLGGYQMLVRGDIIRGKFRNSLSQPEPFVPNEVTKVEFELQDALHTFKKGHRIMVQIQSTWFPLADLNPQKFVDIFHATEDDFQKATQRVYRSSRYDSHLKLSVTSP